MTKHKPELIKKSIVAVLTTIVLIIFDQFTKYLAVLHLKDQSPVILIQKIFQLQYLENNGAAFGMLQGNILSFSVIILVSTAVVWIVTAFVVKFLRKVCSK